MYKLLTDSEKQKVRHEYAMRRAVVILVAFTVVLVVGLVSLFPSYVLSSVRKNEARERSTVTEESLSRSSVETRRWLRDTNYAINLLSPDLDTDKPYEMFSELINAKSQNIKITGFSFVKDTDTLELVISGDAIDRNALIKFESSLEASGQYFEVSLPISNLAKDREITFRITLIPTDYEK